MEPVGFQTEDEEQEEKITEIAHGKKANMNGMPELGKNAQAADTSKGASALSSEEGALESGDEEEARPADEAIEETTQHTRPVEVGAGVRAGKRKHAAELEQEQENGNKETRPSVPRNKRTRPLPRGARVAEGTKTLPSPVSETISADIISSASGVRRSVRLYKKGKKPAADDTPQQKSKPRKAQKTVNHGKNLIGVNVKTKAKAVVPTKKALVNGTTKPRGRKQTQKDKVTHASDGASEQAVAVGERPDTSREVDEEEDVIDEPQKGRYPLRQRRAQGKKV